MKNDLPTNDPPIVFGVDFGSPDGDQTAYSMNQDALLKLIDIVASDTEIGALQTVDRTDYVHQLIDRLNNPPPPLAGDEKLLWGLVHNAGHRLSFQTYRWAAVRDAAGCGRTTAIELCQRFGADPDDLVGHHNPASPPRMGAIGSRRHVAPLTRS